MEYDMAVGAERGKSVCATTASKPFQSMRLRSAFLVFGILMLGSPVLGSSSTQPPLAKVGSYETNDLGDAVNEAIAKRGRSDQENVLIVFDIDNTLLRSQQFLASDQWFNYHAQQIAKRQDVEFETFSDLLNTQSMLLSLENLTVTQPDVSALITRARTSGVDVAILSARSSDLYDATERELTRNGIRTHFSVSCKLPGCAANGELDESHIRAALFSLGEEVRSSSYRKILLRNGIMLTAGQDKGTMLRILLGVMATNSYSQVIFVDDTQSNVESVAKSRISLPLSVYHYVRVPTNISRADVKKSDRRLRGLRRAICKAMSSPFCGPI